MRIPLLTLLFLVINFINHNLFAEDNSLALQFTGTLRCQVDIEVLSNYTNNSNARNDFMEAFGNDNLIDIQDNYDGVIHGRIRNKNGGLDLQILISLNFATVQLEFVGSSLVGTVKGVLVNCQQRPPALAELDGEAIYAKVAHILENEQSNLNYYSLVSVFNMLSNAGAVTSISHLDKLLWMLMECRNEDLRVDRMVLIITSMIIGKSQQEINDISKLFEALIDNPRTTVWVMAYIADALGDYDYEVVDYDRLIDKLEKKLDFLIKQETDNPGEYYGDHFMEPPQTDYVKNYINNLDSPEKRKSARINYYLLRQNYSEEQIKSCLIYLQKNGDLESGAPVEYRLRYLYRNIERLLQSIGREGH